MVNEIITLKSPNMILAGPGALEKMGEEAKTLGAKRALMVTDKGIMDSGIGERVEAVLKAAGVAVDIFDQVESDPAIACSDACTETAKSGNYDIIVGVGGGSSMDIASVASVMCTNPGAVCDYFGVNLLKNPGIPTFLVATTAGTGAEVTPNAILTDTEEKLKKGIVSPYILPRIAVIDPMLMLSMPARVTSFTGMDALCHAIESYTSLNATSLTDMYAEAAIERIGWSLRTAVAKGTNLEARNDMALASLYAGISLANAGVTAVHALAYPLGGEFNVPHGIANGLLLPHVMEFNVLGDIPKFAQHRPRSWANRWRASHSSTRPTGPLRRSRSLVQRHRHAPKSSERAQYPEGRHSEDGGGRHESHAAHGTTIPGKHDGGTRRPNLRKRLVGRTGHRGHVDSISTDPSPGAGRKGAARLAPGSTRFHPPGVDPKGSRSRFPGLAPYAEDDGVMRRLRPTCDVHSEREKSAGSGTIRLEDGDTLAGGPARSTGG